MSIHDSSTRRALRAPLAVLIGFGILTLAGCDDGDVPTALGPDGPVLAAQVNTNPVVNSLADPADADGFCDVAGVRDGCTLREAIAFASTALTTPTITFSVTGDLNVTIGYIGIPEEMSIVGPGEGDLRLIGDLSEDVFHITAEGEVSISGLTVRNGYRGIHVGSGSVVTLENVTVSGNNSGTGNGAGIYNAGDLTLAGVTVVDNSGGLGGGIYNGGTLRMTGGSVSGNKAAYGGGIESYGPVTLTGVTVSDNEATQDGGGIDQGSGVLVLQNSTVSGNRATHSGGGLLSYLSSGFSAEWVTINNSTISGNGAGGDGGGIFNVNGLVRISHSTITGNTLTGSGHGAGINSYNDEFTRTDVKSSIIWGNTTNGDPDDVAAKPSTVETRFNSSGYNLIGAAGYSVDFTQEFNATGDQTGVTDAHLGSLLLNSPGTTKTHALLTGSPAIDAGTCTDLDDATVTTDQRGAPRPDAAGSACDIGAYEGVGALLNVARVQVEKSTTYGTDAIGAVPFSFNLYDPSDVLTEAITIGESGGVATFDTELTTAGTWQVKEVLPSGWIAGGSTSCSVTIAFPDNAEQTLTCSFANTEMSRVDLNKLTQGLPTTRQTWGFALYSGTDGFGGTPLASGTTPPALLGFGSTNLDPGGTYTLCELSVPAGYSTLWQIDTNGDGNGDVTVMPYNPNGDDDPPEDLGNRCVEIGYGTGIALTPGKTLHLVVNNSVPGGSPRSNGYWKNWNACTGGGQAAEAEANGGSEEGFWLLEDVLNPSVGGGITWDDVLVDGFTFPITSCPVAADILDKRKVGNPSKVADGKKQASDPLFNLAAHLLAAQLNFGAGVCTTEEVQAGVVAAEQLLDKYDFNGDSHLNLGKKSEDAARALELATLLDSYNIGLICGNSSD